MKILRGRPQLSERAATVVTMGVFDGGHLGHQRILAAVVREAKSRGMQSLVLTFENHPATVLAPAHAPRLLVSLRERLRWIGSCGVDLAVPVRFTKAFSRVTAEAFVRDWFWKGCRARAIVAGPDTHFGHLRRGNVETLLAMGKSLGIDVLQTMPVRSGGKPVSSTRVRQLVAVGNVGEAAACLGRAYSLTGRIVAGRGRGRRIGVPTLNLDPGDVLFPATGVYAARVRSAVRSWKAVVNVGVRPTFERLAPVRPVVEAHLLSGRPPGPMHGKPAIFEFVARLREERRYPSAAALVRRIRLDSARALRLLGS